MEMIMISPTCLKVVMDADDMEKYELSNEKASALARKSALRMILAEARVQTGFDSTKRRILVRMFPGRDGGCEMFVSRLGDTTEIAEPESTLVGDILSREGMRVYFFVTLSELICACRRLFEAGYREESAAYHDETRNAWYLVICSVSPLAGEMGGVLMKPEAISYINEYCSLICVSAVNILADFA